MESFCHFRIFGFAGRILQGWRARIANGFENFFSWWMFLYWLVVFPYIEWPLHLFSSPSWSGHTLFEHPSYMLMARYDAALKIDMLFLCRNWSIQPIFHTLNLVTSQTVWCVCPISSHFDSTFVQITLNSGTLVHKLLITIWRVWNYLIYIIMYVTFLDHCYLQ